MFELQSNERGGVEDQAHAAVAKDGRTGKHLLILKGFPEALDDHLLLADKRVDEHAAALLASLEHHHDALRGIGDGVGNVEMIGEPQERRQPATDAHHLAAPLHRR